MNWKHILLGATLATSIIGVSVLGLSLVLPRTTYITGDSGGNIVEYMKKYSDIKHTKGKVEIDDICLSACTMITGLVPADRVCAAKSSVLGFHSAFVQTPLGPLFSEIGTKMVWRMYPPSLQEKLRSLGWDGAGSVPHPELILIPGTEVFKECKND